jgi:peptidoglycan/LPS O-acetylase OafA/YrhL
MQDQFHTSRIHVIEALRGIASLGVALFHFSGQLSTYVPQLISSMGWVGVDIFFVISGFVIPYSIAGRSYSVTDFPRFICRRLVRLEPSEEASRPTAFSK